MGFALSEMRLTSAAFEEGASIPRRHAAEGDNLSPPLAWTSLPRESQSLVVFCHDPDAPLVTARGTYGFVHWVLYDIPASVTGLPEAVADYSAGRNDFGNIGYGGPMPPPGHGLHRYFFWVLALRQAPQLNGGLTLWEVLEKVEPSIVGMNRLMGIYERK